MDLNPYFKSASKILFGQDIGQMEEFRPYLLEMVRKPVKAESALSSKEVHLSHGKFSQNAKFIGLEDIKETNAKPIDINKIKDIDSILQAMGEQYYCGNKIIGNSINVINSDSCTDCMDVLESGAMLQDRQCAYSFAIRKGESVFGCSWCGETSCAIRTQGAFFSKRSFESYLCMNCADIFGCMNLRNCTNAAFSFNQVSKNYMIGNLALPKDKYLKIRVKLGCEVADMLRKNKKFPSLFEMVGEAGANG